MTLTLDQAAPDLREMCLFALATGLREANVMGLKLPWIHVDFIEIPAELTKTRKPYGIPLNRTAQGVIEARRQSPVRHVQLVFTNCDAFAALSSQLMAG